MTRKLLMASALSMLMITTAHAGEQYVDETGYAASGYDVVAFFELAQKPVGAQQPQAVPGKTGITAEYNGATWAFSAAQNRDKFVANPAKYAPQYDGHCAYGIAQGGKVPANPNLWRILDGKLYLNITPTVVGFWESDIHGNLKKADGIWSQKEQQPASTKSWKSINDNDGTYTGPAPVGG